MKNLNIADNMIGRCPQLIIYNGDEIKKSERIKAKEMMETMEKELEKEQNHPSQKVPKVQYGMSPQSKKYHPQYIRKMVKLEFVIKEDMKFS